MLKEAVFDERGLKSLEENEDGAELFSLNSSVVGYLSIPKRAMFTYLKDRRAKWVMFVSAGARNYKRIYETLKT